MAELKTNDVLGYQEHYKLANYFLKKSQKNFKAIPIINLQVYMFLGYSWALAVLNKNLIGEGSHFYTWRYTPIHKETYFSFKKYAKTSIDTLAYYYDNDTAAQHPVYPEYLHSYGETDIIEVLDRVWDEYSPLLPSKLCGIVTASYTPWAKQVQGSRIEHNAVKDYMCSLST